MAFCHSMQLHRQFRVKRAHHRLVLQALRRTEESQGHLAHVDLNCEPERANRPASV